MWIEDYKVEGSIVDGVNPDSLKREAEFTPPTSNPKPNKKNHNNKPKPQTTLVTPKQQNKPIFNHQQHTQSFSFITPFQGDFLLLKSVK